MSAPAQRRLDCDFLRVASMIGVVYLHAAADSLRNSDGLEWHCVNLITSLATAAVPLFFMLSGALLLSQEKTADLSCLFRRRLPKVLVPLLAWSAVVVAMTLLLSGPEAAGALLLRLPSTPVVVPYWFLYTLIPLYLLTPLLKPMADALSGAHWRYLLLLWGILTIGFNTLHAFLPAGSPAATFLTLCTSTRMITEGGYVGYFLLGAWLMRLERLPDRRLLWTAVLADVLVIAAGTWYLWTPGTVYDERFKNYLHLFTAVLAASLFLLVRSYARDRSSGRWITLLSGLSFGTYLAHPLAIAFWLSLWTGCFGGIPSGLGQHALFFAAVLFSTLLGVFAAGTIKPLCYLLTGQRFSAACRESNLFALTGRRAVEK